MAEPQGRVTGSDATTVSDHHCPVALLALPLAIVDMGDEHTWGRVFRKLGASVFFTVAVSIPQNN